MSDERTLDLLEVKIEELRHLDAADGIDLSEEIERLETKLEELRQDLYANLSDWERVKLARHPKRPYSLDYIDAVFAGFYELHGDRIDGDDRALLAGLARLDGRPVGGAIAESLLTMSGLRVPIVAVVIGEGGSGGALAIGLADRVLMLENAVYTVISPESAAVILWKDKERMKEAAEALNLTADHLRDLGLIDGVIPEPLGGAHKDFDRTASALKDELVRQLAELAKLKPAKLVDERFRRYREVGRYRDASLEGE